MKFKLGARVRDEVSGFKGVCIGRTEYLNGCIQYGIRPPVDKDGKLPDCLWIDEGQLVEDGEPVVLSEKVKPVNRPGGPMPTPRL